MPVGNRIPQASDWIKMCIHSIESWTDVRLCVLFRLLIGYAYNGIFRHSLALSNFIHMMVMSAGRRAEQQCYKGSSSCRGFHVGVSRDESRRRSREQRGNAKAPLWSVSRPYRHSACSEGKSGASRSEGRGKESQLPPFMRRNTLAYVKGRRARHWLPPRSAEEHQAVPSRLRTTAALTNLPQHGHRDRQNCGAGL